ncbi:MULTISPECIES: flagellar export chaperone FliS [unclassified Paenibacillus]|uniref:flagellar export chaperone FliS n=1 Tax=unclassified Paenibacillus TaxID=185978 RepID=UPI0036D31E2F
MLNSPYQIYQQSSVNTATGGKLLIMLYEGAIRFTKAGIEGIQHKKYDVANTNFKKAQAIIHELIASLNFDYEISNELVRIYEYLLHTLIQANVKKDIQSALEVQKHLQDMLETWKEAYKTPGRTTSMESV